MRKMLFFLAALTVVLAGCSSDGDNSEPKVDEATFLKKTIIGKWVKSEQSSSPDYDNFREAISKDTLAFYDNGRYKKVFAGSSEKTAINGDYSFEGSQLFLSHSWLYYISFPDNNTMRLRETGKDAYVFKYRRIE